LHHVAAVRPFRHAAQPQSLVNQHLATRHTQGEKVRSFKWNRCAKTCGANARADSNQRRMQ
jgi:hypothetical protein